MIVSIGLSTQISSLNSRQHPVRHPVLPKTRLHFGRFAVTTLCLCLVPWAPRVATAQDIPAGLGMKLKRIAQVDSDSASAKAASNAVLELKDLPSSQAVLVFQMFNDATPRGKNWLRALTADVVDNGEFPEKDLATFYGDRNNDADARYLAYQLLVQNDSDKRSALLANAHDDPSLPVRFLRIESLLKEASEQKEKQPDLSIATLRKVVANGRSPAQLKRAVATLSDLGESIDLASELGMIRRWMVIGPFDNTDSQDFDTAYTPEQRYTGSGNPVSDKPEKGKNGALVNWQLVQSDDEMGMVDLNKPLENEKDAATYAFIRFTIPPEQFSKDAQVRIGCITANKIWVNGKLITANEVYHSGSRIDQYVENCQLERGENTVLVKVMQNAQTQPWAQDWQFQFRLTRPDGSAIKVDVIEPDVDR